MNINSLLKGPEIGGHAGPYVQSQRTCLYQQYAQQLLDSGKAFKCFCSSERLQDLRDAQKRAGNPPRYDGKCAALVTTDFDELEKSQKRPYTIRLKLPTTFGNAIVFDDLIHGRISVPRSALDSAILIKSDGLPTYHLANVVDDHLMGITRVIRGKEWIASTPLHILLYEAFGWTPPEFAHLPLLTNLDGTKLSKRQESLSVESLKVCLTWVLLRMGVFAYL